MTPEEAQELQHELSRLQEQVRAQQELIESQAQQIRLLRVQVADLQARLSKDSHNRHLPPSSDRFKRQPKSLRKKSSKKVGGQAGHPGEYQRMVQTPDQVISHRVETCPVCQHDLREVAALQVERRQVVELPPKRVVVIEHQAERKCCPACQEVVLAPFPEEVSAPVQYGPALGALAVYLVEQQLLPSERVSELFFELFGHPISPASIVSLVERCVGQLAEVEEQIKSALRQAKVLHQDETSLSVGGKRHWVHVSATPLLTHYAVHARRGKEALEAIGILPAFSGVSVHDGWRSYWAYACGHATCNVHLLRDLTFLIEEHRQDWAQQMKELLLDMKAATEQARVQRRASLHPGEVADWQAQYRAVLLQGEAAQPRALGPPPAGKGRRKQSAARNLLDRLSKEQDAVLAFLHNLAVPFDKSQVARALEMARGTLYLKGKQAGKDKAVATAIEEWQEQDDTMGHRKLAALLKMGKNRVKRVMKKYGLAARRKKKRYVYPGKASSVVPNRLRDEKTPADSEIVFADIFEVHLADQTKVRGCFALRKRTRHILALAFDYSMRADLVVSTIEMVSFSVPGMIWHSDQGSQYGAEQARDALLRKGFARSMSRAGTPTDNGYAERFVGQFTLAVAERRAYRTLGEFLRAAEHWITFYNQLRPHEGLDQQSPDHYASEQGLPTALYLPLF